MNFLSEEHNDKADGERHGRKRAYVVTAMYAAVALPATLTFLRVKDAGRLVVRGPNPTPYGYTWSLLLFLVPIAMLSLWFSRYLADRFPKRAFWTAIWVLTPLGFGLDFLLGSLILTFFNPGATLGWSLPAVGGCIPIEEYVFYSTGFLTVLLLYLWCDEYWLSAYNVPDYAAEAKKIPRLAHLHVESVWAGLALLIAAAIYKEFFAPPPFRGGFPLYFAFLLMASFLPSAILFRRTRPFINWPAFSFTMFFVLFVSLLWEATLGVPYRWWGYQPSAMIGITIDAWSYLPIEAVLVWVAVTYTTVIFYEAIKIWQASGRRLREVMIGRSRGGNSHAF